MIFSIFFILKFFLMGHHIDVFLVRADAIGLGKLRGIEKGFAAMPLPGKPELLLILDGVEYNRGEEHKEEISKEENLSLVAALVQDTVCFIGTDYFGGPGTQGAMVANAKGEIVFPWREESGVVNQVLREYFGVVKQKGLDEWDTVGLASIRSNDTIEGFALRHPCVVYTPCWDVQRLIYIAVMKPNPNCPLSLLPRYLIGSVLSLACFRKHSSFSYCGCPQCGNIDVKLRKCHQ